MYTDQAQFQVWMGRGVFFLVEAVGRIELVQGVRDESLGMDQCYFRNSRIF